MFFQPGTAACVAVALALALNTVDVAADAVKRYLEARERAAGGWSHDFSFSTLTLDAENRLSYPFLKVYAIVTAWSILIVSGRWRYERSAIDRLGRAVGVVLILAWVLLCAAPEH